MIAERIAACRLPVLTGIGHEINITITDMAAHTTAKTPTAIAQWLVNRVQVFLDELDGKLEQVTDGAQKKIEQEHQRLKDSAIDLQNSTNRFLKGHTERIIRLREAVSQRSLTYLSHYARNVTDSQKAMRKALKGYFVHRREKLDVYERMIDNFHPGNTIKRGFSITRTKDGKALKNIRDARLNEALTTEISDGMITSTVSKIDKA